MELLLKVGFVISLKTTGNSDLVREEECGFTEGDVVAKAEVKEAMVDAFRGSCCEIESKLIDEKLKESVGEVHSI